MCVSDFFVLNCTTQTRGHPFNLYKLHSHSSTHTSFFSIRIINVWNSLPADFVDFSSFTAFKRTVDSIDLTPFLVTCRNYTLSIFVFCA